MRLPTIQFCAPALLLTACGLCFSAVQTLADESGDKQKLHDKQLIAAGQIGTPTTPAYSNILPGTKPSQFTPNNAPVGIFDLFPPVREPQVLENNNRETPKSELTAPMPSAVIEYDESLAPNSNLPGLSVVKAMNAALVEGPRAAAIRAQLAIAMANFPQATQAPNPLFFFDRGIVAEQVNRMGPVLTGEEPWKLLFRLLVAKRLVDQTKIDLLTQIWSLRATVRRAYTEIVVAQETQRTLEELYDISSKLLNITAKRFKAGAVAELDVLKARLDTSQAAVDVSVGKRRVLRAKQQLNILMGKDANAPLFIAPLPDYTSSTPRDVLRKQKSDLLPDYTFSVPILKDFIDRGLTNRLELKSLGLQLKVNQANLLSAYGNVIPNPTVAFGKSTAGNPSGGPKVTAVFFTVDAEFPLSNWNQGNIWNFKATGRQLNYQVLAQQNQVTSDIVSAYNNLLAARKKLRLYQDRLLNDSNEVARLTRRSYEVGQTDITTALNAQQANVQVRSAYLDAVNSYASAFTDLEFAIGKPLQ